MRRLKRIWRGWDLKCKRIEFHIFHEKYNKILTNYTKDVKIKIRLINVVHS